MEDTQAAPASPHKASRHHYNEQTTTTTNGAVCALCQGGAGDVMAVTVRKTGGVNTVALPRRVSGMVCNLELMQTQTLSPDHAAHQCVGGPGSDQWQRQEKGSLSRLDLLEGHMVCDATRGHASLCHPHYSPGLQLSLRFVRIPLGDPLGLCCLGELGSLLM